MKKYKSPRARWDEEPWVNMHKNSKGEQDSIKKNKKQGDRLRASKKKKPQNVSGSIQNLWFCQRSTVTQH